MAVKVDKSGTDYKSLGVEDGVIGIGRFSFSQPGDFPLGNKKVSLHIDVL
jgi:hypothetical protein